MYFQKNILTFVTIIVTIRAFPSGAPSEVCETMAPGHGVLPQTGPFPYEIKIEKSNLKGGESTKVTFRGTDGEQFRGFLIQARTENKPIGVFTVADNNSHTLNCGTGKDNAVTQSNSKDKKEVTVTWTAPENFRGNVTFYVTVVKVFNIYWVAYPSSPVKIS